MLPIYIPGYGWVFQPLVPLTPGCVYPTGTSQKPGSFGFGKVTVAILAALLLGYLSVAHPIEVIGAIAAAIAIEALADDLVHALRRRRVVKKGGWPWNS
ncbi:hypothetical protein ACFXHD_23140 [Streptomyces hydrogenans]|uniref:hypothetical protein n=1 Tax=Streptomyces hydrogenans TaxID=1873719 RepID=UPI0036A2528D